MPARRWRCNYIFVSTSPELLVIEDSYEDARVSLNPFVVGPPHFRFYAGAPLVGSRGERYGTLCVVDLVPRTFSAEKYALLANFAALAVEEIERNKPVCDCLADIRLSSIEANRHLDLSLQASKQGVLMLDLRDDSWPVVFANEAFAEAAGLWQDALVGGNFWDLFSHGSKTKLEVGLPTGLGDTFEMRVLCKSASTELRLRLLPAVSDRFAPSKATGLPAWAPFVGDKAGSVVEPSPGGSEGAIFGGEGRGIVDDVKCFWFAVVQEASISRQVRTASKVVAEPLGDAAAVGGGMARTPKTGGSKMSTSLSEASTATSSHGSPYCDYQVPAELAVEEVGPLLGSGSFGKVYRVALADGQAAALKVVDCRRRSDAAIKDQLREVQLSSRLQHPHVVSIITYATTTDVASGKPLEVLWCAQELCELGTLTLAAERGWLRQERKTTSPADMAVVWRTLLDVASAMAYVHNCSVIHGDLTGRNVLLTSSTDRPCGFKTKVCDFGLARYTCGHSFATDVMGTITHMAPEMLRLEGPVLTFQSDVWAFGVIAWEAYHGKCAYKGRNAAQICVAVARKKALEWPSEAPGNFVDLMKECLSHEYPQRPSFSMIEDQIEGQTEAATVEQSPAAA